MAKKTLQIIETAYRATIEEQDDPIVWVTHAMKGAGADLTVLLRGSAVNYVVKTQDCSGLVFGAWQQTQPAQLANDIAQFVEKNIEVYYIEDDVAERGLKTTDLIDHLKPIERANLPQLLSQFQQVWHW